jgi:hypothetical protein
MSAWCLGDGGALVTGLPVALIRSRLTGSRLVRAVILGLPPLRDRREASAMKS